MSDKSQIQPTPELGLPEGNSNHVHEFLIKIRPKMVIFAQRQLDNHSLAEDMVQEAILGALKNASSFRGEAAFQTWVFAILRRKIADYLRLHMRSRSGQVFMSQAGRVDMTLLFDHKGRWYGDHRPIAWPDPAQELSNKQFWRVFDLCLNKLPERQCSIFMMREYIGLSPREIKRTLGISLTLVNVTLHRARLRLQQCLSSRWFGDES